MLQKADLNILEYRPIIEDRFVPTEYRERIQKENIPQEMKEALLKPTADSVAFVNHSINGDLTYHSMAVERYDKIHTYIGCIIRHDNKFSRVLS